MRHQEIEKAILTVRWGDYETVYGNAAEDRPYTVNGGGQGITPNVETLLLTLFGEDKEAALKASYKLWDELCHQTQVSSAALPAYDILLPGLELLSDELKEEALDILYNMIGGIPKGEPPGPWKAELRAKFERDEGIFRRLKTHPNEGVSSFAELILDQL